MVAPSGAWAELPAAGPPLAAAVEVRPEVELVSAWVAPDTGDGVLPAVALVGAPTGAEASPMYFPCLRPLLLPAASPPLQPYACRKCTRCIKTSPASEVDHKLYIPEPTVPTYAVCAAVPHMPRISTIHFSVHCCSPVPCT